MVWPTARISCSRPACAAKRDAVGRTRHAQQFTDQLGLVPADPGLGPQIQDPPVDLKGFARPSSCPAQRGSRAIGRGAPFRDACLTLRAARAGTVAEVMASRSGDPVAVAVPTLLPEQARSFTFGKITRARTSGWAQKVVGDRKIRKRKLGATTRLLALYTAAHTRPDGRLGRAEGGGLHLGPGRRVHCPATRPSQNTPNCWAPPTGSPKPTMPASGHAGVPRPRE